MNGGGRGSVSNGQTARKEAAVNLETRTDRSARAVPRSSLVSLDSAPSIRRKSVSRARSEDKSGFGVFSDGAAGQAHVMAHQMLDQRRHELGHRWLGSWLATHDGHGSDWTHIQWHMALFELALGQWDAAFARFQAHILPVAATTEDALTDAPALLWRLRLSAGRPVALPWEPVRRTAARVLPRASDPYLTLHCLLAVAGAGDADTLDRWIATAPQGSSRHEEQLLVRLAVGLRAFTAARHRLAAAVFASSASKVWQLGGSHAQNELFAAISHRCWQLANETLDQAA